MGFHWSLSDRKSPQVFRNLLKSFNELTINLRKHKSYGKFFSFLIVNHVQHYLSPFIDQMNRVFSNGSEDQGSIPSRAVPKAQKMLLDAALLNTQHYKVCIKGKVEQCRERSSAPLHIGVVAIKRGAFNFGRQLYFT